jgi:hypothetical protein
MGIARACMVTMLKEAQLAAYQSYPYICEVVPMG